ncbi:MAG: class I SAM-dependent methyltransferase [Rhodocyclaceae bacterium]|nr:class I SAM-dependent methyltransferase [Rhodocyclaceae bacterium]
MSTPPDDRIVHSPHRPLTAYYASESDRRGFVRSIFDSTARHYDRVERLLALGTGPWYRRQALMRAGLAPGMRIVDVGVGTGLVAREAATLAGDPTLVVGVDPSPEMMANADLPEGVRLVEGRAEEMPLPDAEFDMLSMGYALRHIGDLAAAFAEFHRVLKPGGRVCLLEITRPAHFWSRALLKGYMRGVVPALARVVGGGAETARLWRYYWDTIDACASPADVLATLRAAGFTDVRHHIETPALSVFAEFQATKPG